MSLSYKVLRQAEIQIDYFSYWPKYIINMSIIVKPITAILDKDTDFIGKADPYVVCFLQGEKRVGKKCSEGGTKPFWQDVFQFKNMKDETRMTIQVWDKDTFTPDDLMGKGIFDLKKLLANPAGKITQYVGLAIDGKPTGQIQITFEYMGPPIHQQSKPGYNAQPNKQHQEWKKNT